jgi:murein DD-endopeptidase MepM/ murein hydrolase activator NlpD
MTPVPASTPRVRALVVLALSLLLGVLAAPGAGSVTDEEIGDAQEELERIRQEREEAEQAAADAAARRAAALSNVDEAVLAYEEVNAQYRDLIYRTGVLRSRIDAYQIEVTRLRETVRDRAVDAYMFGRDRTDVGMFISSEEAQSAILAREVLAQAVISEAGSVDALEAATAEMERLREQLRTDTAEANDLRIEAEAIADRMYELLGVAEDHVAAAEADVAQADEEVQEAAAEVQQLEAERAEEIRRAEEARRRAEAIARALQGPAAQGVSDDITPGFLCPVAGPSAFTDTWGAPRSGGTRTHKGVDMMGARGTPLVAVGNGYITTSYGVLGGNIVWLHADHGVSYFYAHLDGYPGSLVSGQRVARGDVIGYMGDTGNPAPGAYHLHFGIYPGGASAVNPYPTVARHC